MGITGEGEAFPTGDLFRPLIADPKQPQFFVSINRFKSSGVQYTMASVGFGETFGMYRFFGSREGDGLQLSVEGALFAQFNLDTPSYDLINEIMKEILRPPQGGVFMKTIVTMTMNPAIDKSSSVAHVVAERKLYCKPPRFEPGGGGVNVSRAIKKLGGESILLYPAGGLTGERLKELLDEEGLDHRPFPIEGLIRESLVILEESTGRQYRFGMPGPEFQKTRMGTIS